MIGSTDLESVFSRALSAAQQSSCRYQIYGRKNHGVWGYCIAPTFKASRHQELAAMARESKTLDQVLPDSLVLSPRQK